MTWFRLDDQGAFHAKVLKAGNEAYGAWCRAGQWSSAHGTDGEIPRHVALQIATMRVWKILLSVGLLEENSEKISSFFIHDFLDYNPSSASVEERRRARAAAGSLGGKRRVLNETVKQVLEQEPSKCSSNSQALAKRLLEPCSNPRPGPSRPIPNPEEPPISPPRGASGVNLGLNFDTSDPAAEASITATDTARPEAPEAPVETMAQTTPPSPVKGNVVAKAKCGSRATKSRAKELSPEQAVAKTDHANVVDFWFIEYEKVFHKKPIFTPKEGAAVKSLLRLVSAEEAKRMIKNALSDEWFLNNSRSLCAILSQANKYHGAKPQSSRHVLNGQVFPSADRWDLPMEDLQS